jgi:hypothetical protein
MNGGSINQWWYTILEQWVAYHCRFSISFFGTASARMSDPAASIGHLPSHTIRIRKHIRMMLRSLLRVLRTPFPMLQTLFHVAPPPSSPDIVYMLRAMLRVCDKHVASLWRACCDQHPNIVLRTLFPCCEQLFSCCEHFFHVVPPPSSPDIVHMLRAILGACGEHDSSLWRARFELVTSMLRPPSKHQMQGWWTFGRTFDFFPRRTPDQEHNRFSFPIFRWVKKVSILRKLSSLESPKNTLPRCLVMGPL